MGLNFRPYIQIVNLGIKNWTKILLETQNFVGVQKNLGIFVQQVWSCHNPIENERHNRHYPKIAWKGMHIYDMKDDKNIGSQVEANLCDNGMHLIVVVCKTQRTKGFQG